MNTTNYLANLGSFYRYAEHSNSRIKADSSLKNLEILDILANKFVAKTTRMILNGKFVSKFDASHLQDISNGKIERQYGHYGHLSIDNKKYVRISTCLDMKYQNVQIPIREEKFWNEDTYIFFTNGDLFLMLNSEILKNLNRTKTKLLNYQYNFNDIFSKENITYGLLKDKKVSYISTSNGEERKLNLDSIQLSEKFYEFKSRGCTSSLNPKYLVFERNSKIDFDEHGSTFKSLKAIEKNYKFGFTRQYLGRLATKNAQILDRLMEDNHRDIFNQLKRIKLNNKDYYLVALNDDFENSIKAIKDCLLEKKEEYNQEMDKNCSIKRAIFYLSKVKSSEEYSYYKEKIVEQLGESFTMRDCVFLKEMNQIEPFEYSDGINYHYYKGKK